MYVSGNGSEKLREGRYTFFFSGKNIFLCILKGILPFKIHKIIFFPENLKKNLRFTSKLREGLVTLNTGTFLFGLIRLPPSQVTVSFKTPHIHTKV